MTPIRTCYPTCHMHPFPKSWDIIRPAIQDMLDNAKSLWKINLIGALGSYVAVPLLLAPIAFLSIGSMSDDTAGTIASMGGAGMSGAGLVGAIILSIVLGLVILGLAVWYGSHYTLQALKIIRKETGSVEPKASFGKIPGAILIAILQGLATVAIPLIATIAFAGASFAALFGGGVDSLRTLNAGLGLLVLLSFIPAIFLGVRLQFSGTTFLDQGKRGLEALKSSWKMTDGRFWKILGVLFVFFLVYLLASIVMGIIVAIVGGIFGNGWLGTILTTIINAGFTSFLLAPTAIFFSVRLYEALRHLPAITAPTQTTSS